MCDILYDFIVIGASHDGYKIVKTLCKFKPNLKICFISKKFDKKQILPENIVCVTGSPIYSTFNHGVIGINLSDKAYFGTKIIIATGTKPKKLTGLKTEYLGYKLSDLNIRSKITPIVIVGNNDEAAKGALTLAETHKYIYMCLRESELQCSDELKEKIMNKNNILVLPLSSVVACKHNKQNKLQEVKLSTYSVLKCGFIIAFTERSPELPRLANNMLTIDINGAIKVNKNNETEIIPNIYAIGSCASKTNINYSRLAAYVLGIKNGEEE